MDQSTFCGNSVKPCRIHPLQVANCCRNSRLVVDEDDIMTVANEMKKYIFTGMLLLKQFHDFFSF